MITLILILAAAYLAVQLFPVFIGVILTVGALALFAILYGVQAVISILQYLLEMVVNGYSLARLAVVDFIARRRAA